MTEATTIVSILAIVIAIANVALNVAIWRQQDQRRAEQERAASTEAYIPLGPNDRSRRILDQARYRIDDDRDDAAQ